MSEWSGELRLVAIDGDRVVFHRNPLDEIHLTIGRRYACAIVEIDDQEELDAAAPERVSAHHTKRHPSNQAAILAKDVRFHPYAARRMRHELGAGNLPPNEDTSTEFIRRFCGVSSRADLDTNPVALELFHSIELDFYRTVDSR